MDERALSVKDVQKYLGLASIQSVYHWLNGISMPTIDNLYAFSELFQIPVDEMLCGTRQYDYKTSGKQNAWVKRLQAYREKLQEYKVA